LLNGFVGEFLTLSGAFSASGTFPWMKWAAIISTTGVIWSAGYMLWLYQRTFFGENWNTANHRISDLNGRERLALVPLAVMAIIMGVASPYWMKTIDPASSQINTPEANVHTQTLEAYK
jgi:NADH-quinone oxidoreductase subunit M